jgi:Hint domain
MADSITLTNVTLTAGLGVNGKFDHDTLSFTYPTAVGVPTQFTGSLTFNANGHSVVFTDFQLTQVADNVYVLTSTGPKGATLQLNWIGNTPTSLLGANVVIDERTYNAFVSNKTDGVCFAAGTLIRTPAGNVPVETLKAGDLVLTASGEMRPVKWVGHTDVDFLRSPKGGPGLPVRIAADAFGPARPSEDLYLSAGHSICIDLLGEVLIPVVYLVNESTIAEVETEAISYWHVELDSHDILIANNLPAESYLAMANRSGFEECRGLLPAMIEGAERTHADFCRPVVTEGPVLDVVRQRLVARAEEIGWTRSLDADIRLVADGDLVRPRVEGSPATFEFPASAKDVRLMSNVFSPASFGLRDSRVLGVMLCDGLAFGDRQISLGDARLRDGLHQLENHGGALRRWTDGDLVLDPQLWEGQTGSVSLAVNYDVITTRGWTAPPTPKRQVPSRPKVYAVR